MNNTSINNNNNNKLLHFWDHECIFTVVCFSTWWLFILPLYPWMLKTYSGLCLGLAPLLILPLNLILCFYIASFLGLKYHFPPPCSRHCRVWFHLKRRNQDINIQGKAQLCNSGTWSYTTGVSVTGMYQAHHTLDFKALSVAEFLGFILNIVFSNSVELCITLTYND